VKRNKIITEGGSGKRWNQEGCTGWLKEVEERLFWREKQKKIMKYF